MLPDSITAGLLFAIPAIITFLINAAVTAFVFCDDEHLKESAEFNSSSKIIMKLLKSYRRLDFGVLAFSLVMLCVSIFGALALFSAYTFPLKEVLSVLSVSVLYIVVGFFIPRKLSAYFPWHIAHTFAHLTLMCYFLISPFVYLSEFVANITIRLLGKDPKKTPTRVTEEEILMLVEEGKSSGSIETIEQQMISNIFRFDDRLVSEIVTHRTEVEALPISSTLDDVVTIITKTGYSRIPVYEGDMDTILGTVYVKDLLRYLDKPEEFDLRKSLRQAMFVPESTSCVSLFTKFNKEKTHIAVVIDEYGGTYGIVTMEDLLEVIVGSMQDEYDDERAEYSKIDDNEFILDGQMPVLDAMELLRIKEPEDCDGDTIGGYLSSLLGGVPTEPEAPRSVVVDRVEFTVLTADSRRILNIRAKRLSVG